MRTATSRGAGGGRGPLAPPDTPDGGPRDSPFIAPPPRRWEVAVAFPWAMRPLPSPQDVPRRGGGRGAKCRIAEDSPVQQDGRRREQRPETGHAPPAVIDGPVRR